MVWRGEGGAGGRSDRAHVASSASGGSCAAEILSLGGSVGRGSMQGSSRTARGSDAGVTDCEQNIENALTWMRNPTGTCRSGVRRPWAGAVRGLSGRAGRDLARPASHLARGGDGVGRRVDLHTGEHPRPGVVREALARRERCGVETLRHPRRRDQPRAGADISALAWGGLCTLHDAREASVHPHVPCLTSPPQPSISRWQDRQDRQVPRVLFVDQIRPSWGRLAGFLREPWRAWLAGCDLTCAGRTSDGSLRSLREQGTSDARSPPVSGH